MGPRFSLSVILVLGLAVVVGIWAGRSQSQTVAAPQPTSIPTPFPTPAPGHIDVLVDPARAPVGSYSPATFTLRVGETVTWTNRTANDHTATADNGAFNTEVLSPHQSYSWTPKRAGTFKYSCFIHPDMRGTIVVQP